MVAEDQDGGQRPEPITVPVPPRISRVPPITDRGDHRQLEVVGGTVDWIDLQGVPSPNRIAR